MQWNDFIQPNFNVDFFIRDSLGMTNEAEKMCFEKFLENPLSYRMFGLQQQSIDDLTVDISDIMEIFNEEKFEVENIEQLNTLTEEELENLKLIFEES